MLSIMLIATLLFLASCGSIGQTSQSHSQDTKSSKPAPSPTVITQADSTLSDPNTNAQLALQHRVEGPDGWMWRVSLPTNRLILYYGNPLSPVMGPIGAYSDDELIARLQQQAQVYADLDPAHPVVPGFDYVTPVAQPVPMADGSWVYRMPDDSIEHYINLANANQALFFFDMQIGHSTVQKEVNNVWPYLQRPGVDLSLDPEFDMAPGDVPGVEFGRMYASEINWVIDQLSNLVESQHLPTKILIIHQFLESMLPDWQKIHLKPGVEIVTSVDGFGPPGSKIGDYQVFDKDQLIQYPGFKLFYKLDKPLMSPADVLALDPAPLMVMYQ
ncbi:MAG TPA: hypothetical protein VJ761_20530 [Ktedonobacteraceae bacterium]|nr:hypothetical protein [Ktedonobacteraceae bacterium]